MPGILSLEGAEKIRGEFLQSERAISYYLLIDSGKKQNIEKAVFSFAMIFSIAGIISFGRNIFSTFPILIFLASSTSIVLLYWKLVKNAGERFQKEKVFLTEKNIIVQHALQDKKVKYVPLEKFKEVKITKIPFFGEFATLRYLDGEGIDTLSEPLYFPEKPAYLAQSIKTLSDKVLKEKEEVEKRKE